MLLNFEVEICSMYCLNDLEVLGMYGFNFDLLVFDIYGLNFDLEVPGMHA